MRPIVKHDKVLLEALTPMYFRGLFDSMPHDALLTLPSIDKKMVLESSGEAIRVFSPYFGAVEAFTGLIPVENSFEAAMILTDIEAGHGKYQFYGPTALDRLITHCEWLHSWYAKRPTIPYGLFFLAQIKGEEKALGQKYVFSEEVIIPPYKIIINGEEVDFRYKYSDSKRLS